MLNFKLRKISEDISSFKMSRSRELNKVYRNSRVLCLSSRFLTTKIGLMKELVRVEVYLKCRNFKGCCIG